MWNSEEDDNLDRVSHSWKKKCQPPKPPSNTLLNT